MYSRVHSVRKLASPLAPLEGNFENGTKAELLYQLWIHASSCPNLCRPWQNPISYWKAHILSVSVLIRAEGSSPSSRKKRCNMLLKNQNTKKTYRSSSFHTLTKKVHHKAINPKPIFKLCWFLSFSGFSPLGNLAALLDLSNIWQHFCYAALRVVGGILQGIWHFVVVGLDSGEEIHGLWFAFKCRGRFLDALQVRTAVSPAAQGMEAR